jgi:hypothetical protein
MRPDELERRLPERLAASDRFPRAGLLHVLMLPDFEGADRIGGLGEPEDPDVRRAVDRLRGGSDASGRARRDAAGKRGQQVAEQSQGWRHNQQVDAPDSPDVRDLARRVGADRCVGRRFACHSELDADVAENRA